MSAPSRAGLKAGGDSGGDRRPLLTICIPTYNRARFLPSCLHTLINNVLNVAEYDCELLIADNCSTDDTETILAGFEHPRLRKMRHERHLVTAEENIMRSVKWARGRYIWFLGDDDAIRVNAISGLFDRLRSEQYGLIVYNSPTVANNGAPLLERPIPMNAPQLELSVAEIVESIGFMYTLAGFSNIILRTDNLSEEGGLKWLTRSPIYSHVAWFIEAQAREPALFVNSGVVYYRQNAYGEHWDRVAEREGVQRYYFWSLGLVRLVDGLVSAGAITYANFSLASEVSEGGNRFRVIDEILFNIFRQFEYYLQCGNHWELYSQDEMAEAGKMLIACDPSLFNLIELAGRMQQVLQKTAPSGRAEAFGKLSDEFQALFHQRWGAGLNQGRWVGKVNGYAVYRCINGHVAIDSDNVPERERVLSFVDPLPSGDAVIVAPTIAEIDAETRAGRDRQAQARERSSSLGPVVAPAAAPAPPALSPTPVANLDPMRIESAMIENRALRAEVQALRQSTSWKITAPLRTVLGGARKRA